MRRVLYLSVTALIASCCMHQAYAQAPPWKFSANEEKTSVSFGFLAQPQWESIEHPDGTGKNLDNVFLRRIRFIVGGKLTSKLSYFIESDAPNLGKKELNGSRDSEIFLQDAYVNYAFRPEFQLDGGMLLVPVSHNSQQSAASLLTVDYAPYSFLASAPTRSKTGRDYGIQARGYIKKHFEYRIGAYRGNRNHTGDFPYRYTARFVYYPFEADTGFFYTGTTHGQRKIVGIGASFDRQGNYSANAVDLFVDVPVREGDAITAQANFIRYDGGTSFTSLPQQNTWMLESAYYIKKIRLGPFIQFASRDITRPEIADDKKMQGGIAFWLLKHKLNLKTGVARLFKDNTTTRTQFLLQAQFFYY